MHKIPFLFIYPFLLLVLICSGAIAQPPRQLKAQVWISNTTGEKKLTKEKDIDGQDFINTNEGEVITLDAKKTFQTIDGMGSSLEPATCYNLSQLDPLERERTLKSLLTSEGGINMNLMRICIGTPDFTSDPWYSYSDLPKGEIDTLLIKFSIEKDERYILPVLREALKIRPDLRFFASPWSPPAWMKTSGDLTGGRLRPEFYAAYARYFVKFIKAYQAAGIPVVAVTIQNEPGVNREFDVPKWHYPSCHWTAEQQKEFIKNHLGPEFKRNGLTTEIWCYDHNFNIKPVTDNSPVFIPEKPGDAGIGFPRTILSDADARRYTSAMAFHGYVGTPDGMSVIQKEFPDIPVRFTEGSVFGLNGARDLIAILKNGAVSYNAWVIMLDENRKPNNGPFPASRTIIERNTATNKTVYNFDYYLYGHFMKFISPGSTIISSQSVNASIGHIASINREGNVSVVLVNSSENKKKAKLVYQTKQIECELPGQSVVSLILHSNE